MHILRTISQLAFAAAVLFTLYFAYEKYKDPIPPFAVGEMIGVEFRTHYANIPTQSYINVVNPNGISNTFRRFEPSSTCKLDSGSILEVKGFEENLLLVEVNYSSFAYMRSSCPKGTLFFTSDRFLRQASNYYQETKARRELERSPEYIAAKAAEDAMEREAIRMRVEQAMSNTN